MMMEQIAYYVIQSDKHMNLYAHTDGAKFSHATIFLIGFFLGIAVAGISYLYVRAGE